MQNLLKKTFKSLLIALSMLWLFASIQSCCREDYEVAPPEVALDTVFNNDTFLSYWYFPEGSWWVYKRTDTIADIYDTATVTRTYQDFSPRSRAVEKLYESWIIDIAHTSKHVQRPIQSDTKHINSLSTNGVNRLYSSGGGTYFFFGTFLEWPIELGSLNGGLNTILDTNKIDLKYLSKTLPSVHVSPGYTDEVYESHVWICKNIGFVKYRLYNNTSWELIEYHINR